MLTFILKRWFFVSLLLLLLAACAPKPKVPLVVTPGLESELLDRLAETSETFRSLEGVAKVKFSADGKSFSATQVLFAEKPDRFRVEVLSPFGQPVLLAATDGVELSLLAPAEGKYYRGPATLKNLQRIFRVPLQLPDLVHILLYQVPLISSDEPSLRANDRGEYVLTLQGDEGRREELLFDSNRRLVGANYFCGEEALLKVGYDKFVGESASFPGAVFLEMPVQEAWASVVFSEVQTNVSIPPARFVLPAPAGMEVLPIP